MISDKFLRYALPALLGLYGFLYSFFVPAISLGRCSSFRVKELLLSATRLPNG
jgi:hypothetical protein